MLNTYKRNRIRDAFIISTKYGNFPTHRNIQETLDRILRKIGAKHYGTHATRHTFATMLLSKTSSHQDIKAVAGIKCIGNSTLFPLIAESRSITPLYITLFMIMTTAIFSIIVSYFLQNVIVCDNM